MDKHIQDFFTFYDKVRQTETWKVMASTVEASPWHREANVAVHTQMCVDSYLDCIQGQRTPMQDLITLVSLVFHDFGKPEAEETIEREDGYTYRRYAGHERISANEMMNCLIETGLIHDLRAMGFTDADIRAVKFIVENHLPYGLKDKQKRQNLAITLRDTLGDNVTCFFDQLISDTRGRISDDQDTKIQAVKDWIAEFKEIVPDAEMIKMPGMKQLFVLHGPVGAGKSTWIKSFAADEEVFSEDAERFVFARKHMTAEVAPEVQADPKKFYEVVWQFCSDNDAAFRKHCDEVYLRMIKTKNVVVVDGTNQTRKRRARYISPARQAGFYVKSVEFYTSMTTSAMRQVTRPDKRVPRTSVHKIYMNLETPWYGSEVDDFEMHFT